MCNDLNMSRLLDELVDMLDIPASHYKLATERYRSLGEWLHRDGSRVADFDPAVCPQGSFNYGTVIRPLFEEDEYDLDLVCMLQLLSKDCVTQKYVKDLVGHEIKGYAAAHSMHSPAQEGKRCWRLDYADDVSYHMDILPSIPDDAATIRALVALGIDPDLAAHAIAITDREHTRYNEVSSDWPRSNPKGFAEWFKHRMRHVADRRIRQLVLNKVYATIDEVPAYEWKTPLQRSIQLLKRHRDAMFRERHDGKPISMIITTLAAHAYQGESDLYEALVNIIDGMPNHVRDEEPRIPNPVNPAEDFADRWKRDRGRESCFWQWHAQVKADVHNLARTENHEDLSTTVERSFALSLSDDAINMILPAKAVLCVAPLVHIEGPARPWGRGG